MICFEGKVAQIMVFMQDVGTVPGFGKPSPSADSIERSSQVDTLPPASELSPFSESHRISELQCLGSQRLRHD